MAATDIATLRGRLQEIRIGTDIGLAVGVVCIITILIVPLPPFLLDTGLSLSFTGSILVLMVALFIRRPIDFTSFPTVLLLTTLLRLSLDIAATREILSHGNEGAEAAGHVIAAFGGFLMGGDLLIGLIVFAILIVVNFIVITKGSTRVAEVAARFTLDGIPGNGVVQRGMSVHDAASAFTTLSIGEGLVSQIPALLVSVAAGIVVTKGSAEGTADAALVAQLSRSHKPLAIASAGAFVLAILPGLPFIPFLALSGLSGWGAYYRWKNPPQSDHEVATPEPAGPAEPPITDALKIDQIRLELGYALLVLAGGDTPRLTEQIKAL
ncbi:MAG: EscV/YscV/HrcV family type III secretion system export apparatus protein, partial [Acidiphilium sp. 21-68-69]